MKKFSLFVVVDNIYKIALLFLINLIWTTYLINNTIVSIILSVSLAFAFVLILNKIFAKKKNKKLFSLKQQQIIQNLSYEFAFMSNAEVINYFYSIITKDRACTKSPNHLKIETSSLPILVFPKFKLDELTKDEVLDILKKIKSLKIKRAIILTNKYNPSILEITQLFNIEVLLLDINQTYSNILTKYQIFPENIIKNNSNKIKQNIKQILPIALNKKKSKGYFISAIILFFSSFFVRFKIYYLIFASFLIFLALFSWFNPTFNKINKKQLLD